MSIPNDQVHTAPTLFLLMAQYNGRTVVPLDQVCRDFFGHLTVEKFIRKALRGEIALPILRIETSRKASGKSSSCYGFHNSGPSASFVSGLGHGFAFRPEPTRSPRLPAAFRAAQAYQGSVQPTLGFEAVRLPCARCGGIKVRLGIRRTSQ